MALSREYSLDELEVIPCTEEEPYLPSGSYYRVQIYHAQSQARSATSHHVFGVHFEDGQKELQFFVVDPTRKKAGAENAELTAVREMFNTALEESVDEETFVSFADLVITHAQTYPDLRSAIVAMDKAVHERRNVDGQMKVSTLRPSTMIVLHSAELCPEKLRAIH